jgi:hypothetical protein
MTEEKETTPAEAQAKILGCSVRCPQRIWCHEAKSLCAEDSAPYSTDFHPMVRR